LNDILRHGSLWLLEQMKEHAASPVTYRRGELEAEMRAVFGRTEYEVADEYGLRVGAQVTDFLIDGEDLSPAFGEPRAGDRIIADGAVYEVMPLGGLRHWRWTGPHRRTMRIHTKEVDTE